MGLSSISIHKWAYEIYNKYIHLIHNYEFKCIKFIKLELDP